MRLTCSNQCALSKLENLGEDYDLELQAAKATISKENSNIKILEDSFAKMCAPSVDCADGMGQGNQEEAKRAAKELLKQQKTTCYPGFTVAFDNIDLEIHRKEMTMVNQNKDIHWVNHKMVQNRVSGNLLASQGQKDLLDIPNIEFLPSLVDQQRQRSNYIVLVSRMLVDYFDCFAPLKDVCVQHIPHVYAKEMSEKSKKVPLGVIFKNENVNEDMLAILHQFHSYLPKNADGSYDGQLFTGDQLTVERAVNVISSVSNGYTPEDRLEGIHMQLGDWHAGVKILSQIFKRFFSGKSDGDHCTLYSDHTLINRRNVKGDPSSAYRANRDFLVLVIKSRVLTAAMTALGIPNKSGQPTKCPLPENLTAQSKLCKFQYLQKVSALIVDKFILDDSINMAIDEIITAQERQDILDHQEVTPDGRFPCRFTGCPLSFKYDGKSRRRHELTHDPPPEVPDSPNPKPTKPAPTKPGSSVKKSPAGDDVYSYNCALLADGLFFLNFLDAVCEGDGRRLMRQYKYLLLSCRADGQHSAKYALECLYQSFQVNSLLSPRNAERFVWNRSVNTNGGRGKNVALDLDVEHSNRFLKQAIKNLGPNVTEKAVARICHAEAGARIITENTDQSILKISQSGKHTHSSTEKDLQELIKRAVHTDVYTEHANRHYNHFMNFERNHLRNLDMSSMYKWINGHKKNILLGIRAR